MKRADRLVRLLIKWKNPKIMVPAPQTNISEEDAPHRFLAAKLVDAICFGLLIFCIWISMDYAWEYRESPSDAWPNFIHIILAGIGTMICGWLLWSRRKTAKASVFEINFVMMFSQALADTSKIWFSPNERHVISYYWFMSACCASILLLNYYSSKTKDSSPA